MAPPRFASSAPALQDYSKLISWDQVPRKRMFCCRLDFSIPPHNQYLLHHLLFHRIISTPTDKQENKEIALLQLHFFPTALHNKIPFQQFQQLFSHPSFFFIPGIYLETGILLHRIFLDPPWNSATFFLLAQQLSLTKITQILGTFSTSRCGIWAWPLQLLLFGVLV